MLSLEQIAVQCDQRTLLDLPALQLNTGEFTVLLGPNGAGKSTLMNLCAGLEQPDNGSVYLNQKPLSEYSLELRATMLAVLLQQHPMSFSFSVLDIVLMGAFPQALSESQALEVALQYLKQLEMADKKGQSYLTLSGGEKQRVQLARVLTQTEPTSQWLLLDEPLAAMDLRFQHLALSAVRKRVTEGLGAFVVLHDPVLAAQYADRIILLRDGKLLADGNPKDVLTCDLLTELYSVPVQAQWSDLGLSIHSRI